LGGGIGVVELLLEGNKGRGLSKPQFDILRKAKGWQVNRKKDIRTVGEKWGPSWEITTL